MGTYLYSSVVKVKVQVDNHNLKLSLKSIVAFGEGVLLSHLNYLVQQKMRYGRSQDWSNKSIRSIRLLLDYSLVNDAVFENPREMFAAFYERLICGTIDENGFDPTKLYWQPFSENVVNNTIHHITSFSDWLYEESDGQSALLNPIVKASNAQKILNLAAFNHRLNNSFLSHIISDEYRTRDVNSSRYIDKLRSNVEVDFDPNKAFPEDKIFELLTVGFARKGVSPTAPLEERVNLGNVLITILLHFGGLRISEPFHLYIDDIIPNKGLEQIRVYHPFKGAAPEWYRNKTNQPNAVRETFLLNKYGLKPRWKHSDGKYNAGWKSPMINPEGMFFYAFLFGVDGIESLFYKLFKAYLNRRVVPKKARGHPFLFTNKNGDPLSIESFKDAHRSAIKKIGLVPKLNYGGTPHSHRHAYGTRLANSGIEPFIIKQCMHHKSLESQEVYKQINLDKVNRALSQGVGKLSTPKELPELII